MATNEDTETVTFRIPTKLKRDVERVAESEGDTMTGYLRDALSERLRPRMRMVLQPGLLPLFQAFVDEASHPHSDHRSVVILAARRGIGVCYHGRIEAKDCNESILAISSELPSGVRTTYFVPRANIEAWFGWKQVTDGLVRTLRAQGWVEPTADESR